MADSGTDTKKTAEEIAADKDAADKAHALREDNYKKSPANTLAQPNWKHSHDWLDWVVTDYQPKDRSKEDLQVASSAQEQPLLKPNVTYKLVGSKPLLLGNFSYNNETKQYSMNIDIRSGDISNHSKYPEPRPGVTSEWDQHARLKTLGGISLAKRANFRSFALNFPKDNPFSTKDPITGYRFTGSGTLDYAEIQVRTGIKAALEYGMEMSVSENFIQAYINEHGSAKAAELQALIAKTKENAKAHQAVNEMLNDQTLKNNIERLDKVEPLGEVNPKLDQKDFDEFKKDVTGEHDAQGKKADKLRDDIGKLECKIKEDVGAGVDVVAAAEKELERLKRDCEIALELLLGLSKCKNKLDDSKTSEDLLRLKDEYEAVKNPNQKYRDAVSELQKALAAISKEDRAALDDDTKKIIIKFESQLKIFDEQLKEPLTNGERSRIEGSIKDLIKVMKTTDVIKDRCGAAIDNANQALDSTARLQKQAADRTADQTDKRAKALGERVDGLEKAVADLAKAMDHAEKVKAAGADDPLKGFVVKKRTASEEIKEKFSGLQAFLGHVDGYSTVGTADDVHTIKHRELVLKQFDQLQDLRDKLRKKISAEKAKLDDAIKVGLPEKEQKQLEARLKKLESEMEKIKTPEEKAAARVAPAPGVSGTP